MRSFLEPTQVKQQSSSSSSSSLLLLIPVASVSVFTTFIIVLVTTSLLSCPAEARRVHKRFVIHIPYKVKTHHHTHTVYSLIHSGGGGGATKHQTVYKILGYSKHGRVRKDYRDELRYPPGCPDHRGDMVFNHYSRNDEEERYYPGLEAVFEDEQRDEWES